MLLGNLRCDGVVEVMPPMIPSPLDGNRFERMGSRTPCFFRRLEPTALGKFLTCKGDEPTGHPHVRFRAVARPWRSSCNVIASPAFPAFGV